MTIKELGRWESLEMVQWYTRSFGFRDAMKFYQAPLGDRRRWSTAPGQVCIEVAQHP